MVKYPEQEKEDLNKIGTSQSEDVPKKHEQVESTKEVRDKFKIICYACNGFGHMKKYYTSKYFKIISYYYYNFHGFGHQAIECKKPKFNNDNCKIFRGTSPKDNRPIRGTNIIRNGIMCYKWNLEILDYKSFSQNLDMETM